MGLIYRLGVLFLLCVVGLNPGPALADRFGFGRFQPNPSNIPKSVEKISSPDIPGDGKGYRFSIYGGKCVAPNYKGQDEGDCTFKSVRSQMQEAGASRSTVQPDAAWYAWDFYMPSDFPTHPKQATGLYNYAQWKGVFCPHAFLGSDQNSSQLFLMIMRTTGVNDCMPKKKVPLMGVSNLKGRWTSFEVYASWSFEADGEIIVFANGKRLGGYNGPTLMPTNKEDGRLTKMNHFDFGPYLCCTAGIEFIKPGSLLYANARRAGSREDLAR